MALEKNVKLEYIWLDGDEDEPTLRSKTKVMDIEMSIDDFQLFEKLGSTFKDRAYFGDQCSVIPLSRSEMSRYLPRAHLQKYNKWISDVYQAARPMKVTRTPDIEKPVYPQKASVPRYKSPL